MSVSTNPRWAAFTGASLILPFVAVNAIVGNRIEPFFSLIRPGLHTSATESVLLVIVLLCLPAGAFIAIRPMLERGQGRRGVHAVNLVVAAVMVVAFATITTALGAEIYRCDVLRIPNCD